ncbi:hypothetical protein [Hugenholtzia roseola]|uniref:hypothetical protein n=1 Tax=Hugenholtzia roseola TaxID=1002 RepID=UPI00041701A9|nr:hypothetical protein [Hugenholtzia roseola]
MSSLLKNTPSETFSLVGKWEGFDKGQKGYFIFFENGLLEIQTEKTLLKSQDKVKMSYSLSAHKGAFYHLDLILEKEGSKDVQRCLFELINPQQIILALGKEKRPQSVENGVRLYKDLRKDLKAAHK